MTPRPMLLLSKYATAGADLVTAVVQTFEQLGVDGPPRFITDAVANLHRKNQIMQRRDHLAIDTASMHD